MYTSNLIMLANNDTIIIIMKQRKNKGIYIKMQVSSILNEILAQPHNPVRISSLYIVMECPTNSSLNHKKPKGK